MLASLYLGGGRIKSCYLESEGKNLYQALKKLTD